jgi:hypothetical protein
MPTGHQSPRADAARRAAGSTGGSTVTRPPPPTYLFRREIGALCATPAAAAACLIADALLGGMGLAASASSDSGDFSGIFGDIGGFKGAISPPLKKPNFDCYPKLCRPMCSGDRDLSDNI